MSYTLTAWFSNQDMLQPKAFCFWIPNTMARFTVLKNVVMVCVAFWTRSLRPNQRHQGDWKRTTNITRAALPWWAHCKAESIFLSALHGFACKTLLVWKDRDSSTSPRDDSLWCVSLPMLIQDGESSRFSLQCMAPRVQKNARTRLKLRIAVVKRRDKTASTFFIPSVTMRWHNSCIKRPLRLAGSLWWSTIFCIDATDLSAQQLKI